jgi:hypothetical protein
MAIVNIDADLAPVATALDARLEEVFADGAAIAGGTPATISAIPGLDRLTADELATGRAGMESGFMAFMKALVSTSPVYHNISSFLNGFSNHGDAAYGDGNVRYWKDPLGYVQLDGLANTPAAPAGLVLGTMPTGYRPLTGDIWLTAADGSTAKIQIGADGNITVIAAPALTWMSLAGIRFFAG